MGFSRDAWENFKKTAKKTNNNNIMFWKPQQEGKYLIRFFASPNETNPVPFTLVVTHWVPSGDKMRPVLCTERSEIGEQKPCPICQKRKELFASNIIENVELAKRIGPSKAYVQWGFVKEPNEEVFNPTPKLIGLTQTPIDQITDMILSFDEDDFEDAPDIFDIKKGTVVILNKTMDGQFPKYTATVTTKKFDLSKDPYITAIKETAPVAEAIQPISDEEMKIIVNSLSAMVNGTIEEDIEGEDVFENMSGTASIDDKVTESTDDIDALLDV